MKSTILALTFLAGFAISPATAASADNTSRVLEEERLEQSGTVITIIFDDSGSMAGQNMDQAKRAFRDWLPTVPDDYRIGLSALNAGRLVDYQRGNKSTVADAVARIQASGGTPLADAIDRARAAIAKRQKDRPFERHVLLVFTDGEDSSSRGAEGVQQGLIAAARARIETVGIGFRGQGDYMASTATRYFDANNAEELKQGLAKVDSEIGDTSDIVISPEIAQAMKSITPADLTTPAAEAAAGPTSSKVVKKSAGGFSFSLMVVVVIGILVLFRILRKLF